MISLHISFSSRSINAYQSVIIGSFLSFGKQVFMFMKKLINPKQIIDQVYSRHGAFRLYLVAFVLSVISCLSLGILQLFSVFSGPFEDILGYSQPVINRIIICQTTGLSLFTPLCGYIADAKGIWILCMMALGGYLVGFNIVLEVVRYQLDHRLMYLAFLILGCSHSSLLFSSLLNSAKAFGKYYKTLSISTPNMMVAFSSFLQIHILGYMFKNTQHPTENFIGILNFFFYSLLFSTVISLIACILTDLVVSREEEEGVSEEEEQFSNFAASPLLTGAGAVIHSPTGSIIGSPRSWYVTEQPPILSLDDEISMLSSETSEHLTAADIYRSDLSYSTKIGLFFRDYLMYPLICCCLMSIGATEFFVANIGSIIKSLKNSDLEGPLQVFSITATLTRFLIMTLTDYICTKFSISRLTIFLSMVVACGLSHFYLSLVPVANIHFDVIVVFNSILNSAVFTLFPAILASIYGLDILGTTWGLFSFAAIIGNLFFNLLFSFDFSTNCTQISTQAIHICSSLTFFTGGCILVSLGVLLFCLKHRYIKRAPEFF